MNIPIRRILIVDDCAEDRASYRRLLQQARSCDYVVSESDCGADGLAAYRREAPDCILLDYRLLDMDGVEFLDDLAGDRSIVAIPVVMLTGQGNETVAVRAMKHGAQDYLTKGSLSVEVLLRTIDNAIEKRTLQGQLQATNKALEVKNTRLAEMCNMAHEFVDHVSHEFRTPLTVIKEFASIMFDGLAGETTEDQRQYLEIIVNRVDDLSALVDDMLDTSKLEAGLLGISHSDCRLEEIVEHIRTTLERRAAACSARLKIEIAPGLPTVYCDPEKIGRVITNFVINALKFCGQPGAVTLIARPNPEADEVVVSVVDNGPGIPPGNLQALFRRFQQIDGQFSNGLTGFGLGLSIAKELVGLNFGDITVESEEGHGSTFSFTIPFSDRRPLLRRFLRRSETLRNGATRVTLVQMTAEPDADPEQLDEFEHFVNHHTRRGDLLFRTAPHRWLMVATQNQDDVQPMIDRVEEARAQSARGRTGGGPLPVRWEQLGSWSIRDEAAGCIERFIAAAGMPEPTHA